MSARLRTLLTDYGSFHRSRSNELCHAFGIPFVVIGAARLLATVSFAALGLPWLTLAEVAFGATLTFYARLDRGLAFLMAAFLGTLVVLGHQIFMGTGILLVGAGGALQLVGHYRFEKRPPAFMRNPVHLLVGPAWLAAKLIRWR